MFVSLDKMNKHGLDCAMVEIDEDNVIRLKLRHPKFTKQEGHVPLYGFELLALCKRAIKRGVFSKEDL